MRRTHKVFVGYFSTEYPKQHIRNLVGYFCPKARNIVVFRKSFSNYDILESRRAQKSHRNAPHHLYSPYTRRQTLRPGVPHLRPVVTAANGLTTGRIRSQMVSASELDLWPIRHSSQSPKPVSTVDKAQDASHAEDEQRDVWFCCILFPTRMLADEAIERLREIEVDGEGVITREWIERRSANERRYINATRFIDRRSGERRTYSFTLGS